MYCVRQKVDGVLWLTELNRTTAFDASLIRSVMDWDKRLKETGRALQQDGPPRRTGSLDNVKRTRETFQRSPRKSVRPASLELGIPHSTALGLHKRLELGAQRLQLVQKLTRTDQDSREQFALEILPRTQETETCFNRI
jgi:hypothetical protein